MSGRGLSQEEHCAEIDLYGTVPDVFREIKHWNPVNHTGAIDQNIQSAHKLDYILHQQAQVLRRGPSQIDLLPNKHSSPPLHRGLRLFDMAAVHPHNIGPGLGQSQSNRLSHTRAGPGHHRHSAIKIEFVQYHSFIFSTMTSAISLVPTAEGSFRSGLRS